MSSPADTYGLLGAFVDELARCGMRDACTSPGSRCTPLVLTLARERRLSCHSHIDERCAGFFALGLAKASGRPVAIVCTSGTAVAELLPAVVEAHEARVPLIVLSADRPPELRELGAGQAIDQLKIFGGFAKWFFEVGTHDASAERARWMRALACRAYWTALADRPGVVHLNFPLREPLVCDLPPSPPDEGRADVCDRPPFPLGEGRADGAPWINRPPRAPNPAAAARALLAAIGSPRRGVIVAGRHERDTPLGEAAAAFCELAGWPLLADPMSGARRGGAAIAHYDALLRDPGFAREHTPDLVIRVGDLPVSKPLRTWLEGLAHVPQIALDAEGAWQDPASVVTASLAAEPAATFKALVAPAPTTEQTTMAKGLAAPAPTTQPATPEALVVPIAHPDWLSSWRSADERAAAAILPVLAADGLSEPAVAAELGVLLPEQATLFVASSMPVRDIETFWPTRPDPPRVLCNRGANGIDGTVSSAFGAAAANRGPVVLLIGDVALAHDIGGLLAATRLDLKLTIVLLNNEGGGIFDFLPVAGAALAREPEPTNPDAGDSVEAADIHDPPEVGAPDVAQDIYTHHVATPTGIDFAHAAELYGLHHHRVTDVAQLRSTLEDALARDSTHSTIIEAKTDRTANVELHRRAWEAVARSLAT
jgi:2-succinyl-5-enolpyruvyl-6-hydroxy-3-cyclohexene-1-carboxylate synthase